MSSPAAFVLRERQQTVWPIASLLASAHVPGRPRAPRPLRRFRPGASVFPHSSAMVPGKLFLVPAGPYLRLSNLAFRLEACRSLLPGGEQPAPVSAQPARRGGEVGALPALAWPPEFPRPRRSGRLRQQQVRRELARIPNRQQRLQIAAACRTDTCPPGQGERQWTLSFPAGRNIVRRPTVPAICVGRVACGTSRSRPRPSRSSSRVLLRREFLQLGHRQDGPA
jgi:hypothetical protein